MKNQGHTSNSRRYLAPLFALSCSTCLANKSVWIGGCFAIPGVVLFWRCISAGSDDFLDERDNNRSCSTEPSLRLQEKDNSIFLLQQFKDYLLENLSRWITLKSNLFLSKWENQYLYESFTGKQTHISRKYSKKNNMQLNYLPPVYKYGQNDDNKK